MSSKATASGGIGRKAVKLAGGLRLQSHSMALFGYRFCELPFSRASRLPFAARASIIRAAQIEIS